MSFSGRNILVLSSWSYHEPLTHSYLLPNLKLVRNCLPEGSVIFLQTFEKKNFAIDSQETDHIRQQLLKDGIEWVKFDYHHFGIKAIMHYPWLIYKLVSLCRRKKISVLHPFAPVAGFTAMMIHKFYRCRLILDSWEPHAESMVESGVWRTDSLSFKLLWKVEKDLAATADVLMAASSGMKTYASEKWGLHPKHVFLRPACVDMNLFRSDEHVRIQVRKELNFDNSVVMVCAGKLEGMYMRDESFALFKAGTEVFGPAFRVLLLSQSSQSEVAELQRHYHIPAEVIHHIHVRFDEMPRYLQAADFAYNPQRPVPSKRYGTPVKDGEYWAMGLPLMIMPDISEDSDIVQRDRVGVVMNSAEPGDMLSALTEMKSLLENDKAVKQRCVEAAVKYRSYEISARSYKQAYALLMQPG